ncbi:AAR189Cp [Eremothecium gossypii ATCC 10895]|uniref:AAR189Cp n=1 Tax=Eremothecium gossypii (strain ATCC 10895 / CBS 109.51 / FGSC 9923 / NRRL Y-1056) TaxID=284811 RepID=Q75E91_EREGS|nr:AAR189Cp [Eremothecium gossypii ATCC 10895]AAS50556.1 AAR189Cp [Eremothecium gossypii ATCC 10895]AEY94843.1 FAAR189Cp [Eremothecium gossypii FDAG1]
MRVDYEQLVSQFPRLKQYWDDGRYHIANNESLVLLNQAILKQYFGLEILDKRVKDENLFPRVPGRALYCEYVATSLVWPLLWLSGATSYSCIDVGTGAYAIYAMLLVKMLPHTVQVFATDISTSSLENAAAVVRDNGLESQIRLLRKGREDNMFDVGLAGGAPLLVMCNPPFYATRDEIEARRHSKTLTKALVPLRGTDEELVTEGGEVGFGKRMITDSSLRTSETPAWFTTLVAKYESLAPLVAELIQSRATDYHVVELLCGDTRRWILCWNFNNMKALNLCRQLPAFSKHTTVRKVRVRAELQLGWLGEQIVRECSGRLEYRDVGNGRLFIRAPNGAVWTRRYRRNRTAREEPSAFVLVLDTSGMRVHWLEGSDPKTFQSFSCFVERVSAKL